MADGGTHVRRAATPGGPAAAVAVATALLAVAAVLLSLLVTTGDPDPAAVRGPDRGSDRAAAEPPPGAVRNAVVFLVDDMSDFSCSQTKAFLPDSSRWWRRGTCYENASTATPVCCPARAQLLTGQLPHNNEVRTQYDARLIRGGDTVQADLTAAGLRTYGVGKFLNGLKASDYRRPAVPDGIDTGFEDFDFWNSYRYAPGSFLMYDDEGTPYTPQTGLTTTETNGALVADALDDHLASGERFFVYDAFFAPHKQTTGSGPGALPEPGRANRRAPVPPFRYAPEADTRDKLPLFARPRHTRAYYQRLYTARVRALHDVDDEMAAVFRRLEEAGAIDDTVVLFTSDNGYTDRGQVNWEGKAIPYPASTDVPMLAWYPGSAPRVDRRPVGLVDVAATLYDVLGVEPAHRLDGYSLRGRHVRRDRYSEFTTERDAAALAESGRVTGRVPSWRMLERGRWSYVEWRRRDGRLLRRELYADPQMLRNVLWRGHRGPRPRPAFVASLHRQLARYTRCAGTVGSGVRNPCP
jgi:N-acetylglucosamine-6-sulfatase